VLKGATYSPLRVVGCKDLLATAPKGTPPDTVAKLNVAAPGQDIASADQLTPQARGAWQKAEIAAWRPIVKEAGIEAE